MPTYLSPGVYVEEFDSGPVPLTGGATAVPAFIGYTAKVPNGDFTPQLVTSWAQYQSLYGNHAKGALLPYSVQGYFNNGGNTAYIVPIDWIQPPEPGVKALAAGNHVKDSEDDTALTFRAWPKVGDDLLDGEVVVSIEPPTTSQSEDDEPKKFDLRVRVDGKEVEHFADLSLDTVTGINKADISGKSVEEITALTKTKAATQQSNFVTVATDDSLAVKPGTVFLVAPDPTPKDDVTPTQFGGQLATRTGIAALQIYEDVTMLIAPDLYTMARMSALKQASDDDKVDVTGNWRTVDEAGWKMVQTAMITHCENQPNRMAILDTPPGIRSPQKAKGWLSETAMYSSAHAALYYPWIEVANPLYNPDGEDTASVFAGESILVPPSGHMAGVWGRTDSTRGVWKAPANEVVQGALNVDYKMTSGEQEQLNPNGINAIRPFGTYGIRVWGARTLAGNAQWEYIPVRRLFSWVEKTIMDGTNWVVFEPNDQTTWDRVVRTVSNFLIGLWRDGALFGATPADAFYVTCDETTNPPDSIDEGKLVCEIGIAPVKPAEFVIFRVTQWKPE